MSESGDRFPSALPQGRQSVAHWVWLCAPLLVCLAVIALNSTDLASSAHTDVLLSRFLHLFLPGHAGTGSGEGLDLLSRFLRKGAHVVEYALLGLLLARAVRGLFPRYFPWAGKQLLWKTAAVVVPFGLVAALVDELHQTFVSSRHGSPLDVVADLLGLCIGVWALWLVWRRRRSRAITAE